MKTATLAYALVVALACTLASTMVRAQDNNTVRVDTQNHLQDLWTSASPLQDRAYLPCFIGGRIDDACRARVDAARWSHPGARAAQDAESRARLLTDLWFIELRRPELRDLVQEIREEYKFPSTLHLVNNEGCIVKNSTNSEGRGHTDIDCTGR